jgi:transcriptional regulator with XRE-family HTH domain
VNSVDQHIGTQISSKRIELGLSRDQLAARTGIPPQELAAMEAGFLRAAPQALVSLSLALDVGIAHFFAGMPEPDGTRRSPDFPPSATIIPFGKK